MCYYYYYCLFTVIYPKLKRTEILNFKYNAGATLLHELFQCSAWFQLMSSGMKLFMSLVFKVIFYLVACDFLLTSGLNLDEISTLVKICNGKNVQII